MRLRLISLAIVLACGFAAAAAEPAKPPAASDVQDFVFLGEARPVLVRLQVRVNGKPVQAAWDEFMARLFEYLDVNGDGVLDKAEAERVPSLDQILSGSPVAGLAALGGFGGAPSMPSFDDLDSDKDGKVTRSELAGYYQKRGSKSQQSSRGF